MPANRIPFLIAQPLAQGRFAYYWKPSPKLRRLGWLGISLGEDYEAAVIAAIRRNREVAGATAAPVPAAPAARIVTFRQLVRAYQASEEYAALKPKTRLNYRSSLGALEPWGGDLPIRDIDGDAVMDLRDRLVAENRPYRTAALLRVLALLFEYGRRQRLIEINPARNLKIPSAPTRKRRLTRDEVATLAAAATAHGSPHVAVAVTLGFYTVQREADLLAASSFTVQRLADVSPYARTQLAGPDGHVLGVTLQQQKTGEWVAIALHPLARAAIDSAVGAARAGAVASTRLIADPFGPGACADWRLQRDFRAVVRALVAELTAAGRPDAAARFAGIQFRDLRRSGMCWMRDLGVGIAQIAAISGHSIEYTQKILDTYMPRDTRAAAEGMAMAIAVQAERDAAEKRVSE